MPRQNPPRHVLVGYEPSGRSDAAVTAALDMRERFGARLEIVHAVDVPAPESVAGRADRVAERNAEILALAREHCDEGLGRLLAAAGVKDAPDDLLYVATGHPAATVVERAKALGVDLIVIGPHERKGFIDFGSTARAILGKAGCDVWMQPGEYRSVKRLLVPSDLSEDARVALAAAREVAKAFGAAVRALHCYSPPQLAYAAGPGYAAVAAPDYVIAEERKASEERFRREMEAFDWKGVEHELVFVEGIPVDAILDHQDGIDLIAMGSHGRTGFSAVVLGNTAYGVMKEAKVPVLAIRHASRSWLLG